MMSAPECQSTRPRRTVQPVVLDMRLPDEQLRQTAADALRGTVSPMLAIAHHGCERQCEAMAHAARTHHHVAIAHSSAPQHSCELSGPLEVDAASLRESLGKLSWRLVEILAPGARDEMECRGETLEGSLCLRVYPPTDVQQGAREIDEDMIGLIGNQRGVTVEARGRKRGEREETEVRLGAHVDYTLLTLLWADAEGVEVLSPRGGEAVSPSGAVSPPWTAEQVMALGIPTTADADTLRAPSEDEWALVTLGWGEGVLLLTVGAAWLGSCLAARSEAQCAVLHRVRLPCGASKPRHSLPFLVHVQQPAPEG